MIDFGIDNVTAEFSDLAPEDKVYRTAEGFTVKVKCLYESRSTGSGPLLCHLSGSLVGPDGKALRLPDGDLAVYRLGRGHSHHFHVQEDPRTRLEWSRLQCVRETVNHHLHQNMLREYTEGLDTVDGQVARKAAEALAAASTRRA